MHNGHYMAYFPWVNPSGQRIFALQHDRGFLEGPASRVSAGRGMSSASAGGPPSLREVEEPSGNRRVELSGAWTLAAVAPRAAELARVLRTLGTRTGVTWDLAGITALDHAGAALLWRAWGRRPAAGVAMRAEHAALFRRLAAVEAPPPAPPRDRLWPVRWLGLVTIVFLGHLRDVVALVGAVAIDAVRIVGRPSLMPWREISANVYRTGTQAVGITALVGFLVGVVLSFLSANQLKLFGADVFIINILGVSVTRELGPVLAAILVAGRSGSSMTAQLGVMRVTQELDALSVMGIPHSLRLILPKMLALAIALPLLIVWTNAIALVGGMVAAYFELGIGFVFFATSLPEAVPVANLWLGVGKGVAFGILIALVACHFGLRIRPNTESLGEGTTNSVVTAITVVILADAVFAVIFRDVGLAF